MCPLFQEAVCHKRLKKHVLNNDSILDHFEMPHYVKKQISSNKLRATSSTLCDWNKKKYKYLVWTVCKILLKTIKTFVPGPSYKTFLDNIIQRMLSHEKKQ